MKKQLFARLCVKFSIFLSLISFISFTLAFYFPNWKHIKLPDDFKIIINQNNRHYIDPLLRGEIEKYIEFLYRRGDEHTIGLFRHCLKNNHCGLNRLLSFSPSNYGLCHHIDFHRQCIFSSEIVSHVNECRCESPSYVELIKALGIINIVCQLTFIIVNVFRLVRQRYRLDFVDDIHLRSMGLVGALFSSICSISILIQQRIHRFDEALEFLESMRRNYSTEQIYSFSKDLETVIEQIRHALDFHFGISVYLTIIVFILSLLSLLSSSIVEIKIELIVHFEDESKDDYYQNPASAIVKERSIPWESFRNVRQTRV